MDTSMDQPMTLEDIAHEYGKMVSSICRRMITDEETARDAAQQVWTEIVKSFPSFRGQSKVSTWIYTITRRIAADYAVNEKTYDLRFVRDYFNSEDIDPPHDPDLDKALWVKQTCDRCVTAMLHCVDNESRLAHIFRDVAELEYGEIAGILETCEQQPKKSHTENKNVETARKIKNDGSAGRVHRCCGVRFKFARRTQSQNGRHRATSFDDCGQRVQA